MPEPFGLAITAGRYDDGCYCESKSETLYFDYSNVKHCDGHGYTAKCSRKKYEYLLHENADCSGDVIASEGQSTDPCYWGYRTSCHGGKSPTPASPSSPYPEPTPRPTPKPSPFPTPNPTTPKPSPAPTTPNPSPNPTPSPTTPAPPTPPPTPNPTPSPTTPAPPTPPPTPQPTMP